MLPCQKSLKEDCKNLPSDLAELVSLGHMYCDCGEIHTKKSRIAFRNSLEISGDPIFDEKETKTFLELKSDFLIANKFMRERISGKSTSEENFRAKFPNANNVLLVNAICIRKLKNFTDVMYKKYHV